MCPAGQLDTDFTPQRGYKSWRAPSARHRPSGRPPAAAMKVLVLLAVLSASGANILWQEPPKTSLDVVKEAFWDYVAKATLTAEESLNQIRQSELGQEVNSRISGSADTVHHYVSTLRAQAAPLTQDFLTRFSQEAEQLKARLEKDLSSGVSASAQEMVAQLQGRVEELQQQAAAYAEAMDPEALKAVLLQRSRDLRAQLDRGMGELRAQTVPYTEEMRQKMERSVEDFQSSLLPLAQSFQSRLAQKSREVGQSLAPYGEELRAQLDAGAQDLQDQLATLWDSFTRKTQ